LVDAARKGDNANALHLHETLLPLTTVLFDEPSPAVTKALLHATGKISTPKLRAPMTGASKNVTQRAVDTYNAVQNVLASL
jgi:4-hydroxy-tetrahydrodipicolinate synthase